MHTFALDLELFSLKLKLSQFSRVRGQMQKKIPILTRFCLLAIVLINIQKSPSFLVALFADCCIIFKKSVLYPGHKLIAGGCILIEPPCLCLAPFCTFRLDFIIFFCWYLTKNFGTGICAERFEQLASVINFRVCGGKIRREKLLLQIQRF